MLSRDGGNSATVAVAIGAPATIGTSVSALPPGTTARRDRLTTIDVDRGSDTVDLPSASEAAVLAGANLAVVGHEMIPFVLVEAVASRCFRLSALLRSRRGREAAVMGHRAGELFVLLDDRVVMLGVPGEALGPQRSFKAAGPGENLAALSAQTIGPSSVDLRPLSPVTVTAATMPNVHRAIGWQRRSRAGFAWADGADVPITENSESYRVTVRRHGAVVR